MLKAIPLNRRFNIEDETAPMPCDMTAEKFVVYVSPAPGYEIESQQPKSPVKNYSIADFAWIA